MTVDEFLEEYKRVAKPRLEKQIEQYRAALAKMEREYLELYGLSYERGLNPKV